MSPDRRRLPFLAGASMVLVLLSPVAPASAGTSAEGRFRPAVEEGIKDAYVVVLAGDGKAELDKEKIDAAEAGAPR